MGDGPYLRGVHSNVLESNRSTCVGELGNNLSRARVTGVAVPGAWCRRVIVDFCVRSASYIRQIRTEAPMGCGAGRGMRSGIVARM